MVLLIIAGLSIAAGAALVGIGMGSFRRPKIVPADSPKADEAATTPARISSSGDLQTMQREMIEHALQARASIKPKTAKAESTGSRRLSRS